MTAPTRTRLLFMNASFPRTYPTYLNLRRNTLNNAVPALRFCHATHFSRVGTACRATMPGSGFSRRGANAEPGGCGGLSSIVRGGPRSAASGGHEIVVNVKVLRTAA